MERYRITPDASVYFVTYSVVEWLPVFVTEQACRIIADSLSFCHQTKQLRINAFVIMPSHLHLIVFDHEHNSDRLADTLTAFRKFTGRQLSDFCCGSLPACFGQTLRTPSIADRDRRFWQPSRHPVAIENEPFWTVKLNYLHGNPVRKGLVTQADHWRFSSARYYATEGQQLCDVPVTWLEW